MSGRRQEKRRAAPAPRIVVRVAAVDIWAASLALHTGWLSPEERQRHDTLRKESSRVAYLLAHVVLRLAAAELTGEAPGSLRLAAPAGRPPTAAGNPALSLSLSHTQGLAAAAAATGTAVGVDVERRGTAALAREIAATVLSASERMALEALADDERGPALSRAWVRKEAVLKAAGVGLTVPPDLVEVGLAPAGATPATVRLPRSFRLPAFAVADLAVPAGFDGAFAWRETRVAPHVEHGWSTPDR